MARCDGVASACSTIADDLAVLGAQDAAVAGRVGQRRGQHRRRGRLGAVGGDQIGQRVGVQQRDVARGHDDDAGEVVGQRGQAAQRRRARCRAAASCTATSIVRPSSSASSATAGRDRARGRGRARRPGAAGRPWPPRAGRATACCGRRACAAPSGCRTASGCRPRRPAPGPRFASVIDLRLAACGCARHAVKLHVAHARRRCCSVARTRT